MAKGLSGGDAPAKANEQGDAEAQAQADPAAAPVLSEDRVRELIAEVIPTPEDLAKALAASFPTKDEWASMLNAEVAKQIDVAIAGEEFRTAISSLVAAQVDVVLAERAPATPATPAPTGDAMVDSAAADRAAIDAAEAQRVLADKAASAQNKAWLKARDEAVKSATADFELAQAGEGGAVDIDGAFKLRFADNEGFIASLPAMDATAGAGLFVKRADQLIQAVDIPFSAGLDSALITAAWLISDTGSRKLDVSGGLRVGGGSEAKFPAGHIAFLVG